MKWNRVFIVALILFVISACSINATTTPTNTPEPTVTIMPSSTYKPTPSIPYVDFGTIYFQWGLEHNYPYLVWGAQLRDTMKGSCEGFICDGIDLRLYDPDIWQFLGRGEFGKKTFSFDVNNNGRIDQVEQFDTFVITWNDRMGFDALSGTTPDGKTATYGYLTNGKLTTSYMDSSNFPMSTIIDAENKFQPVKTPCGIIDPNPDGDKSYNLTGNYDGWTGGGIVFNFLDRAWGEAPYATRKGYSLISLTIVSAPASEISPDQICP